MHKNNPKTRFSSHVWGSGLSGLLNLAICRASNSITWFEVPLLNFEINSHIFGNEQINFKELNNNDINYFLSNLNLEDNKNFQFIEKSGYRV